MTVFITAHVIERGTIVEVDAQNVGGWKFMLDPVTARRLNLRQQYQNGDVYDSREKAEADARLRVEMRKNEIKAELYRLDAMEI